MKTKQRTLLGLLVLVLLLGGALTLLTRQNQKAEQAASEAAQGTIPLSSFAADDLTEIVVTYNGETNTLQTAAGHWPKIRPTTSTKRPAIRCARRWPP